MTLSQTLRMIDGDCAARLLRQGVKGAVRSAAGSGFGTLFAGSRIVDDKWTIHQAHQGVNIIFTFDSILLVGREAHGDTNLIGDPVASHAVAELFADQTADVFAAFRQRAVPGGPGDFVKDAGFQFQR